MVLLFLLPVSQKFELEKVTLNRVDVRCVLWRMVSSYDLKMIVNRLAVVQIGMPPTIVSKYLIRLND